MQMRMQGKRSRESPVFERFWASDVCASTVHAPGVKSVSGSQEFMSIHIVDECN